MATTIATHFPAEMAVTLKANATAWENFNKLAPSYKKDYVNWITTAKRPQTKERRLQEAIKLLEQNKKLGMT